MRVIGVYNVMYKVMHLHFSETIKGYLITCFSYWRYYIVCLSWLDII